MTDPYNSRVEGWELERHAAALQATPDWDHPSPPPDLSCLFLPHTKRSSHRKLTTYYR